MRKYCPVCKRYYEPKKGAENMAVDCPYCWEGRTLGVTEPDDWMIPITKCTQCGADIHAGDYGAYWGMCPKCAKARETK